MPITLRIALVLGILFVSLSLFGFGETIYDIRVQGNSNIDAELITTAVNIHVGDALNAEDVAKSIKNLYKLNILSDIQFISEPYRNGVNIIIQVVEYPIVSEVEYNGFKVLKKDKIEELITLRAGSHWSSNLKNQVLQKLKGDYLKKGYENVQIKIEEHPAENNRVKLTIKCFEYKRISIKEIVFNGNNNFETKKLLKRMKTKTANLFRGGRFEDEKFEADLQKVIAYYQKNGYIDARINSWEKEAISDKTVRITINIEEGEKYRFGSISTTGNTFFTSEAILANFNLKAGEPFNQEKFNLQLQKAASMYYEDGYIYSQMEPVQEKTKDLLLNIVLQITEGTRAKIREIHITGNRRTKEKVIRRQLDLAPGDYFRRSRLISSQQNIYNLGFFEPDIGIDYNPINNNGDIDLHLNLVDKSAGSANGGIGYNSQDKFVGQLSVSQSNLFGNNWASSLKWEFGGNTQNFELDFTNPNLYDTDILLGTNLYYTKKNWSSFYYEIMTRGGTIRVGQPVNLVNRSRLVLGYSLYSKNYTITDMAQIMADSLVNANLIELNTLGWRYTSALNLTLNRDTRDNIYFPTSGSQFTLYSEIAGSILGGDFDYYKQIAQVNWYLELFGKLSLRNKWRFGYTEAYGRSEEVPPDEKFYLGGTGADGIRGYADRSISPAGGGTREIIYSTEVGYPIGGDQVIGLLFFDAGNSYNKLRDFNFQNLKKGVGAGVRVRSPFGLIGFDYALNLDDNTWEPHLQFGTTF